MLFSGELVTLRKITLHPIHAAAAGEVTKSGVALTAGDVVLFEYKDKDNTAHAVVAADTDALAIR